MHAFVIAGPSKGSAAQNRFRLTYVGIEFHPSTISIDLGIQLCILSSLLHDLA